MRVSIRMQKTDNDQQNNNIESVQGYISATGYFRLLWTFWRRVYS